MFIDGDWIESKVIEDTGIRYLTTGNIGPGYYKEQGRGFISEYTFEDLNCTEVFPGDLVMSRLNKPIGRACIIPNLGHRIIVAVDNVILRPNQNFERQFLLHVMNSDGYSTYTDLISRGATMQRISRGQLGNINIPAPSPQEQTQIANYLDYKTGLIDSIIAQKEELIKKLKEQRQAIINEAVTKGLNKNVKLKDSGIEWLGEIPEHWSVVKLFHLCDNIGSGTTPKSDKREYYDGEIGWLNTGDLNDSFVEKASKTITKKALEDYSVLKLYPENSIVIALYGATIGKLAIIGSEMSTNQACCVLNSNEKLNYKYLFFLLLASRTYLLSLSYGGGQPNISQEIIKQLRVTLPDINEQEEIVKRIEEKLNRIDKAFEKTNTSIQKLKEYRQSLISEAVTGKIDVRDWQAPKS
jgi:type I restriction enzyme S subunit